MMETVPRKKIINFFELHKNKYTDSNKKNTPAVASYPVLEKIKNQGETLKIKPERTPGHFFPVILLTKR
ncbi:MAG: hypothetical protein ACD_32C00088G0002 [uncultured bacterium]|nr:MAG: hypothetical protein ACD_32C00088G0002 [uncultured bacterium]